MSVASQCSDCCTCPSGDLTYFASHEVTWLSTASYPSFCGFSPYVNDGSDCTVYRTKTITGTFIDPSLPGSNCEYSRKYEFDGAVTLGGVDCETTSYATITASRQDDPDCETITGTGSVTGICSDSVGCEYPPCTAGKQTTFSLSATGKTVTGCDFTGSGTETLSDPDTLEDAILRGGSPSYGTSKCAYTGSKTGCDYGYSQTTVGSFVINGYPDTSYTLRICYHTSPSDDSSDWTESCEDVSITTDGDGVAELEWQMPSPAPGQQSCFQSAIVLSDNYAIRFLQPKFSVGCLRASWIEREAIASPGVGLTSIELVSPGVYRPLVSISSSLGGEDAYAVAVMSSTGTISSIRILNPGSGYTSAPTVTIEAAINGGTTSTGWAATITDGQVTSITGGTAGNYLPSISFSGAGGTSASATCTMSPEGGIATITLSSAGSGYMTEPSIVIQSKSPSYTIASVIIHLGTETEFCEVWDKVLPEDYDPNDPDTWPFFGPYESTLTSSIVHIRTSCDCSSCP